MSLTFNKELKSELESKLISLLIDAKFNSDPISKSMQMTELMLIHNMAKKHGIKELKFPIIEDVPYD